MFATAAAATAANYALVADAAAWGAEAGELEALLSVSFVEAKYLTPGNRIFTNDGVIVYVGAPDVYLGQDGYVVVRGTLASGEDITVDFDLNEVVEVLL